MTLYLGDISEDESLYFLFSTRDTTGAAITLAGTPSLEVYINGVTVQSTAGLTLTVDFDGKTGSHLVDIDTSANPFYAVGSDFSVKLAAGTVDGIDVTHETLAVFSIENRFSNDAQTNYDLFTAGTNEDSFKATGFSTPTNVTDAVDSITAHGDFYWPTATGFSTVNPDNTGIAAIQTQTDQLAFTVANQVDSNALTGGGGDDAATIYSYFVSGTNEDAFKADVTSLATATALATVDTNVDAILVDTGTTIPGTITTVQNDLDIITGATGVNLLTATQASIDAIEVDTNELQADDVPGLIATAQADLDIITGASGVNLLTATQASIDAIEADTNELQTDDVPGLIAALNNVAATDIVSAGAITTLTGAVVNVDLVDLTTTNTDMVGTDNAALATALTTVDTVVDAIKVKTDQLAFTVANQVDSNALTGGGGDDAATVYSYFTTGTNEDAFKADITSLATSTALATVDTNVDAILIDTATTIPGLVATAQADLDVITDTDGVILGAAGVDLIWDEILTGATHNIPTSAGKRLRQLGVALAAEGEVIASPAPTATTFATDLTNATDGFYDDQMFRFTSGQNSGQARTGTYDGAAKSFTFDEAFSFAPTTADTFEVVADHVHTVSQIQSGLATEAKQDIIDANVDQIETTVITNAAGVDIAADIIAIKAETALIVADTNELQTDDVPGLIGALNDVAATEIVSAGAITTLAGAVVNVDLVDLVTTTTTNTDMVGTANAALAADLATVGTNVDSILVDTATTIPAQITALNDISTADVNAQVLDVMTTDTFSELSGVPAATASITDMLQFSFMIMRNLGTQTDTVQTIYNNAGVSIGTATVADDTTTFTRGKLS
tara:strand:- start:15512 stop:18061 length:2550 start_codon:yes stop_codon:yes gene_type:complete